MILNKKILLNRCTRFVDGIGLLLVCLLLFFAVLFIEMHPQEFIASLPLPNVSLLPPQSLTLGAGPLSVYSAHILCAAHTRQLRAPYSLPVPGSGLGDVTLQSVSISLVPRLSPRPSCCRFDLSRTWHFTYGIVVRGAHSGT